MTSRLQFALLSLFALLTGCEVEPMRAFPAPPQAAVNSSWARHIKAAIDKDLDVVMAIYTHDVIYSVYGQELIEGRDALRESERDTLETSDLIDARHETLELRVFGDFAFEIGSVVGPIKADGKPQVTVTFRYTAIWRYQDDGVWRIMMLAGTAEI